MSAALNCYGLVDYVAFNTGSRCEAYLEATYTPDDAAVNDDVISDTFPFNDGPFTNCQQVRSDITLDLTFDLNVSGCLYVPCYDQVAGKHRRRGLCFWCG